MRSRNWSSVVTITLFAALAVPAWTAAQDDPSRDLQSKHHKYKLKDLGTLGGPQSIIFGATRPLNNEGVVTGCADTSTLDPNNPQNPYFSQPNYLNGSDPYIQHAFEWRDGVMSDLGTLPGGTSSCTQWISERGLIVGGATNGVVDPLTGYPEVNAVLWKNGIIRNLGTLGGNESVAFGLNNHGQAVGFALNAIPDPYTNVFAFGATQAHAFLWQNGAMHDLGTLGGPDSIAYVANERGQVAGLSFTNSIANGTTGVPTLDPFLWVACDRDSWDKDDWENDHEFATAEDGRMIDLGTLGGTFSVTNDLNNRGQVVGNSNLAGDTTQHPFLWDKKTGMIDLGTFGGSNGSAQWINDAGEVVGQANLPGDAGHDAFLWKNGLLTNLGNLGKTSAAEGINSRGQIVGGSRIDSTTVHAFLWEHGGPIVDLNSLVPPGSGLTLTEAWSINDRGEIAGWGELANSDVHVILLVPCDEEHPGECEDYSMIEAATPQASVPTKVSQGGESSAVTDNPLRNRFEMRYQVPDQPAAPPRISGARGDPTPDIQKSSGSQTPGMERLSDMTQSRVGKGGNMKSRYWGSVVVMTLFTALAMPVGMAAQDDPSQDHKSKHHKYKLIDLGTFGGPAGLVPLFSLVSINSQGTVIVQADTTIPDPHSPNCFWSDCLVNHVGMWQDGVLTDLGVLPGVNSGQPLWINDRGVVVGASENGLLDPLTGFPEIDAVVWKRGQIIDIGTLGGNASAANAINNRGEVTGLAFNTILDPFQMSLGPPSTFWAFGVTQMHAFLWRDGTMQDLGTLGGPDSVGEFVNERGQVAGVSYTSFAPNPSTGIPTQDPFLWIPCNRDGGDKDDCENDHENAAAEKNGRMIDLGTLGGTSGWPWGLNNRGQVTGQSNLADDVNFHAFLWERGVLKDLGTLGGNKSSPRWINDAGEIVGRADLYPGLITRHGFLWKKGVMTDLGVVAGDPCSTAYAINSSEQIVGVSSPCGQSGHGFLWENGGPIVDLQTLVLPGSDVTIKEVYFINDAGEIAGFGTNSNGDQRGILLIPDGDCDDDCENRIESSRSDTVQHLAPDVSTMNRRREQ